MYKHVRAAHKAWSGKTFRSITAIRKRAHATPNA
jgi:hypothetical protein